ncbi:hypothetical protein EV424DRAFT_1350225 [Suillus variegatus]|nr:hypothetical protein EV424DRAFT_1350225 [Suillus variegatus]
MIEGTLLFDPTGFLDQAQGSEKRKYDRNLLSTLAYTDTGEKVKQSLQAQPGIIPYSATYVKPEEKSVRSMDVEISLKPEEGLVGRMDVDIIFLFDINGDIIIEIPLKPEEGVVGWMDVDIDFLFNVDVHVIMEILQPDDKLEWHMDIDVDIVMHESIVIAQTA